MRFSRPALLVGLAAVALVVGLAAALTPRPGAAETPEQLSLRFFQTVFAQHDEAGARAMLCPDGYDLHVRNIRQWLAFWRGDAVVVAPHDFRVVQAVTLTPAGGTGAPIEKVWVTFRYRYRYEGVERDMDMDSGWPVLVERTSSGSCVAPWAGG